MSPFTAAPRSNRRERGTSQLDALDDRPAADRRTGASDRSVVMCFAFSVPEGPHDDAPYVRDDARGEERGARASTPRALTTACPFPPSQGVLRACEMQERKFLTQSGSYFELADGSPCTDAESVGMFARALVSHARRIVRNAAMNVDGGRCKEAIDLPARCCAALVAAYSDGLDDAWCFGTMTETQRTDRVTQMMAIASRDLSDRSRGKAVGLFLRLDIDLLEREFSPESVVVESEIDLEGDAENEDMENDRMRDEHADVRGGFEDSDDFEMGSQDAFELDLFRAKMRIFLMIHVVLGVGSLSHLYSQFSPQGYGVASAGSFTSFTVGFIGLLSTRTHTSVNLLRVLTAPNFPWIVLKMDRFHVRTDGGEVRLRASVMNLPPEVNVLSIRQEMALYQVHRIDELTAIAALLHADHLNVNLEQAFDPFEVFNEHIAALSKLLMMLLRETSPPLSMANFTSLVFGVIVDWDPIFKLMLLGTLFEACPQTMSLLVTFFSKEFRPASAANPAPQFGTRDLPAVRVGSNFLGVCRQRHDIRLASKTCVVMFKLATDQWSDEESQRVTLAILRECRIDSVLYMSECDFGCCRCGINENVLAILIYLCESGLSGRKRAVSRKQSRIMLDDEE